jgi:hypothetical protein
MMDCLSDIYVSTVITAILTGHIRRLHISDAGVNSNLYISIVLTNVIRTVVLSVLNLVCTVYFLVVSVMYKLYVYNHLNKMLYFRQTANLHSLWSFGQLVISSLLY